MTLAIVNLSCMAYVATAAVAQFGWFYGGAIAAFTWLVTPYGPRR